MQIDKLGMQFRTGILVPSSGTKELSKALRTSLWHLYSLGLCRRGRERNPEECLWVALQFVNERVACGEASHCLDGVWIRSSHWGMSIRVDRGSSVQLEMCRRTVSFFDVVRHICLSGYNIVLYSWYGSFVSKLQSFVSLLMEKAYQTVLIANLCCRRNWWRTFSLMAGTLTSRVCSSCP